MSMFRLLRLLAVLLGLPLMAWSQDSLRTDSYFRVDSENDIYQKPITDRYYSNGLRLTWLSNYWHRWPTHYLLPTFRNRPGRRYDLLYDATVGQEIYTPRNIRRPRFNEAPAYYDRPYAGYLFAAWGLTVSDGVAGRKLTSQLTLGVLGPLSLGAEAQKELHYIIHDLQPLGWDKQIQNSPVVNYYVRYEGRPVGRLARGLDVVGAGEANAGTLTNYLGAGLLVRAGLFNDYFQQATGLYDPARPGTRRFQLYAFVRPTLRAVLDNSSLSGGWYRHQEPYSVPFGQLRHGYAQLEYGVSLAYQGVQLGYSIVRRGREYNTGEHQQWGRILMLWRW